jgi:mono/diheme cytochrome c family protein
MRLMFCCVLTLVTAMTFAATPTAEENYKKHCSKCHGPDGKAQTRLGKKSGAKDLTDKNGQAKLSDDDVFRTIKLGRKDKNGEEKMDAFGGDLSDPEITALVAYVRHFAK